MPRYLDRANDPDRGVPSDSEYQLELGAGSLIGLLCIVAVLCGLFFAFGYTLGKHAVPASFSLGATPANTPLNGSQATVPKPNPSTLAPTPPAAQGGAQPPNPADLSAAERNQTPATLQPPAAGTAGSAAAPTAAGASAPPANHAQAAAAPPTAALTNSPPKAAPGPPPVTVGGNYAVQVFAGNNSADAMNLAAALKARQYPVYVVRPRPNSSDQLYRVQVGPYATQQEADEMRARLAADGYNVIIKH
ncbi:MAG: SPOR domain-containing protein [Terriglobales bacterium]